MTKALGAVVAAILLLNGCAGVYVAGDAGAGQGSATASPQHSP